MTPLTIGLTGGIASGKSRVGQIFSDLGVPIIDADLISRDLVVPGSAALGRIRTVFGERFLQADGSLNRALMRAEVFGDGARRRQLEQILHPLIAERMQQWRDSRTEPYCILSAAILIEARMYRLVHRVLVIDVPAEVQHARLLLRDGISAALADEMVAAQLPREQRLQNADDVIDNSGTLEQTREQVIRLHTAYLQRASEVPASRVWRSLK